MLANISVLNFDGFKLLFVQCNLLLKMLDLILCTDDWFSFC